MPVEKTIEPAEAKYVIKKTDPAYSMLRSVAMGRGIVEHGHRFFQLLLKSGRD